jgi:hypothetical protein
METLSKTKCRLHKMTKRTGSQEDLPINWRQGGDPLLSHMSDYYMHLVTMYGERGFALFSFYICDLLCNIRRQVYSKYMYLYLHIHSPSLWSHSHTDKHPCSTSVFNTPSPPVTPQITYKHQKAWVAKNLQEALDGVCYIYLLIIQLAAMCPNMCREHSPYWPCLYYWELVSDF